MVERAPVLGSAAVIKVGGSLAETGRLKDILKLIGRAQRAIIVVPGGGAFADKVRNLQRALGFSDRQAHRLAMLGMHQMAEIFLPLEPRLALAESEVDIVLLLKQGRIPVWLPLPMLEGDDTIPADWTITSDGLSARLAERMGIGELALLKSLDVAAGVSGETLARDGVVDKAFPGIVQRAKLNWRIFGPGGDGDFRRYIGADFIAPGKS